MQVGQAVGDVNIVLSYRMEVVASIINSGIIGETSASLEDVLVSTVLMRNVIPE